MKESILKNKYFICFIIYGYILFLCFLFPMHYVHEFEYMKLGNPFYLQWQEFFQWHGRLLTHIPVRYTLQLGYPFFYIFKSFVITILFFVSLKSIDASIIIKTNRSFFLLLSIFLLVNALFPFTTFMMYYSSDLVPLYTYYITAILMIIYLQYYLNIFNNKTDINIYIFYLVAFLTGSTHEQAITMIPLLILVYILLKVKNVDIPYWYWYSIPFFLMGFSIILFAPGSNNRIGGYINTTEWEFMGQSIDWMELGWKRYFYSLYKHIFITTNPWYSGPGFVPSTWYLQILIFIFSYLNIKKYKSLLDNHILFPFIYWALSWGTCLIMLVSPSYHGIPVEFSKFFMYISLTASVYYFLKDCSVKIQTILTSLFLLIVFIGQGIQIPAIYKAKQEYLTLMKKIESGSITEIKHNPTAKIGNITIIKFGDNLYYKYPHIKFNYTN